VELSRIERGQILKPENGAVEVFPGKEPDAIIAISSTLDFDVLIALIIRGVSTTTVDTADNHVGTIN